MLDKPLATLEGHMDWVLSAVFSPDGSRILMLINLVERDVVLAPAMELGPLVVLLPVVWASVSSPCGSWRVACQRCHWLLRH
jgi:hypothetical protein